jgi:putative endonuclease
LIYNIRQKAAQLYGTETDTSKIKNFIVIDMVSLEGGKLTYGEMVLDDTFYKGSSENYISRFEQHNAGLCQYTSTKMPWELFYVEEQTDKKSMIIRERKLKRCKSDYFEWLRHQPSNILKRPEE